MNKKLTVTEMRHKKEALRGSLKALQNKAKVESRELTSEEDQELTDLIVEIEQIDLDIEAKKQELLALESKKEDFTKQKQEFEEKIDAPVNSNSNRSQRSFNLSKAVSAIVNGHPFDEVESRYINVGKQKADASGLSYNGQIVLPIGESRDVQAKTGLGLETIETEVLPIIDPLRNNLVLAKAGATIMTGLKGNIQIPIYQGTTAVWNAETNCQPNTQGGFIQKNFAPLRLTAVLDISKQWLIQDSSGAEQMLQRDIINSLSEQLEKTLLGSAQGTQTQPAGIGSLITPVDVVEWKDTVALETALRTGNYNGKYQYIMNPYANGYFSVLPKDTGSGIMAITDGKLNGNVVDITNSVFTKGGIVGDWSQYFIFIWDSGIDITVDEKSLAYCGKVRITANMYVNGGPRDLKAFQTFVIDDEE